VGRTSDPRRVVDAWVRCGAIDRVQIPGARQDAAFAGLNDISSQPRKRDMFGLISGKDRSYCPSKNNFPHVSQPIVTPAVAKVMEFNKFLELVWAVYNCDVTQFMDQEDSQRILLAFPATYFILTQY